MTTSRSSAERVIVIRGETAAIAALGAEDFDTVVVVASPRGPTAANDRQEGDSCWQSTRST
jgi:hypothetical protein